MLTCFVILVSFLKIMFSKRWRKSRQYSAVPMCVPHMNYTHVQQDYIHKVPSLCMTTLAVVSQTLRSYFSHMVASTRIRASTLPELHKHIDLRALSRLVTSAKAC
jgi:hypothetical protein